MMKIAILTLPLTNNYGGYLQAFALQEVLHRMGHEAVTLHLHRPIGRMRLTPHFFLSMAKRFVQKYIQKNPDILFVNSYKQVCYFETPQPFLQRFLDEHIKTEEAGCGPLTVVNDKYDAYVVGSDQVWRPLYYAHHANFYLDFVENENAKRVAYAASFGTDRWEVDEKTSNVVSKLAKEFDAISVRERSGISLCKDHLGVNAVNVVDPTLLLNAEDYREIYNMHPTQSGKEQYIATYVLDKDPKIQSVIHSVSKQLGLPVKQLGSFSKSGYDSIESWLEGIDKAAYVVTDSFHGSVFSMIFRKQFVALGNKGRGMARFEDLFSQFQVPERLVCSNDEAMKSLTTPINYDKVYEIMNVKRLFSEEFLDNNLR